MSNPTQQWTKQELALLEQTIGLTHQQSLEFFREQGYTNRGFDAIKKKRTKLGISDDRKWTTEEIKTLEDNYMEFTDQELVNQFFPDRKFNQIAAKRAKLGLLKESQWTSEEIGLLKTEYHKGIEHCISLFPQYTKGSIKWLGRTLGLSVDVSELRSIYTYNKSYFADPNPKNCYVAGFIAADGSLRSSSKSLAIVLHLKDKCILENFKQFFEYTGQVIDGERIDKRTGEKRLTTTLCISCGDQWYTDLEHHFNIVPNKTKILKAPNLSCMDHKIAYAAGYIDGDGSIFWSGGKFYLSFLGTESVVRFIKEVFDEIVPIPDNGKGRGSLINMEGKYSFPLYKYTLSGKRAIAICQYIKQYDLPLLERKWSKVL